MAKLKVGVVGVGGRGAALIRALSRNDNAEIAAVCDVNEALLSRVAEELRAARYADYQRMFKEESLNAAVVSLPHYLYPEVIEAAFEAGVDVLKEKPLAKDLADARRIVDLAEKHGRRLMVAAQSKFHASFSEAKLMISSGRIGRIFLIVGRILYRWRNAFENKWGWRGRKELSGGVAIVDSGWHILDLIHWFKGMPCRVQAFTGTMKGVPRATYDTDDKAVVNMEFPDGSIGSAVMCFITLPGETRIVASGTDGSIDVSRSGATLYEGGEGSPIRLSTGDRDATEALVEHFLDCVTHEKEPRSGARESLQVARIVDAAYRSAETGQVVELENEAEEPRPASEGT